MEATSLTPVHSSALTRLWHKALQGQSNDAALRESDQAAVFSLGLGMQELLQHLYGQRPPLAAFLEWAAQHRRTTDSTASEEGDVLSAADLEHWKENGFVVLRHAVSAAVQQAAANAIWEHLGASPGEPESWYQPHASRNGLMVLLTQHPALEAVRRSPRIRRAFEQLYGTTAIYPVVDKVSFNPPETKNYSFMGSPLHWDTSLDLPVPLRLQGLLYLTDTKAGAGAFQCVPGFHNRLATWLESLPPGTDARQRAASELTPVDVEGSAGDFIIWHAALPHCASPNRSTNSRLVQYLTYLPDGFEDVRPWR